LIAVAVLVFFAIALFMAPPLERAYGLPLFLAMSWGGWLFVVACGVAGYLADIAIGESADATANHLVCSGQLCTVFRVCFYVGAPTLIYLVVLAFGHRYRVPYWSIVIGLFFFFCGYVSIHGQVLGQPAVFVPRLADVRSYLGLVIVALVPALYADAMLRLAWGSKRRKQEHLR
jgi:hypothetical protein